MSDYEEAIRFADAPLYRRRTTRIERARDTAATVARTIALAPVAGVVVGLTALLDRARHITPGEDDNDGQRKDT